MANLTSFEDLLLRQENIVGPTILVLLSWVAKSDEKFGQEEIKIIEEVARKNSDPGVANEILQVVSDPSIDDVELAIELAKEILNEEQVRLLLELSISVVVSDNRLTPEENYTLRFLADVFRMKGFFKLFEDLTGQPIPEMSDLSRSSFWDNSRGGTKSEGSKQERRESSSGGKVSKRSQALSILGLEEGASQEEIRNAYKRLAHIHHPDRYETLGEEAKATATENFRRIKQAYEMLKS